jgi:hypothetical protein
MRKASLILGVLIALLAGAPSARAQGAVKPGGFVGGGGAGVSSSYILPVGSLGGAAARSTSTGYILYGGPAAAIPIGPIISQGLIATPNASANATIGAQVTNGVNVSMLLYYRLGGEAPGAYRQVTMTSSDTINYTGTIPATDVGIRGLEYYIYGIQGGGVTTRPFRTPRESPQQLAVQLTEQPVLNLYDAEFRMFGMSFSVSPSDVAQVFSDDLGDTNQTQWKLGRWSEALGAYQRYNDVGPISRGRGYWLITRGGRQVDASGLSAFEDTTVGGTRYAKLVLQPGWNQIANPFAFPVSWAGRVPDPAGGVETTLWSWTGTTYETTTILYGFMGYWVNNTHSAARLLLLPYAEATIMRAPPPVAKTGADSWRLGLQLSAGDVTDATTEIGLAAEASNGYDAADYGKPPCPPGRFLAISSLLARDGARATRLAGDFRAPGADGWRFPLLVQGNVGAPATLRVTDLSSLPEEYAVALVDLSTDQAYDLRADGGLVLPLLPSVEGTRYDLVVGTEAWLRGEVGETTSMPRRTALLPNYPNPFNPSTKLAFELIAPSHARLEIFDVAGRHVVTLLNGQAPGGRHVITWDGRDNRGRTQASGAYFCRLTAGGVTQTRPLTMLK